jgi:hypothetical protein
MITKNSIKPIFLPSLLNISLKRQKAYTTIITSLFTKTGSFANKSLNKNYFPTKTNTKFHDAKHSFYSCRTISKNSNDNTNNNVNNDDVLNNTSKLNSVFLARQFINTLTIDERKLIKQELLQIEKENEPDGK